MGTNYYLYKKEDTCKCCKRPFEPLHIGKSSYGWVFALHIIPEDGIHDLDDWEKLWNQEKAIIKNEYDEIISPEKMMLIITDRDSFNMRRNNDHYIHHHGTGTWDCLEGEFS